MQTPKTTAVSSTKTPSSRDGAGAGPSNASPRAELLREGAQWFLRARDDQDAALAPPTGSVPALVKSIAIISYLNNIAPRSATLAELSSNLGITKSHCCSILKTLVYFNWLHFDGKTKFYRLRSGILRDASSLLDQSAAMLDIRDALVALAEASRFPCVLSQPLADDSFVVIDKFNVPHVVEVSFPIGHRFSRNACAQMRALLAWQSPEQIDRWFKGWQPSRDTGRSSVTENAIRAELKATRERGYARSVGESIEGLMTLALPIFGRTGEVAYIFNCSSLIPILEKSEQDVAGHMIRTMEQIHRMLGSLVPPELAAHGISGARANETVSV